MPICLFLHVISISTHLNHSSTASSRPSRCFHFVWREYGHHPQGYTSAQAMMNMALRDQVRCLHPEGVSSAKGRSATYTAVDRTELASKRCVDSVSEQWLRTTSTSKLPSPPLKAFPPIRLPRYQQMTGSNRLLACSISSEDVEHSSRLHHCAQEEDKRMHSEQGYAHKGKRTVKKSQS